MEDRIHLVPTTDIPVMNPETKKYFPPEGEEVDLCEYIDKRMREGLLAPESPVGESPEVGSDVDPAIVKELSEKTVKEIRELAAEMDVELPDSGKKAELVQILAQQIEGGGDAD